jgi:hypothetical protein
VWLTLLLLLLLTYHIQHPPQLVLLVARPTLAATHCQLLLLPTRHGMQV